ncbi:hypothetical protein [Streptomyces xiaopingdaonensis]|uniref:hypothetical protein n=1 Tax=Streptomyces xiaopingdaonensis TaxID=1565415 RepID=UPI00030FD095|nr:hypothetical protein [Streptomyces xiaopingdaonensis]
MRQAKTAASSTTSATEFKARQELIGLAWACIGRELLDQVDAGEERSAGRKPVAVFASTGKQ